jgi:hypothetical protein
LIDRIDPVAPRGRVVEPVARPRVLTPAEREEERRRREEKRRLIRQRKLPQVSPGASEYTGSKKE